MQAHSTLLAKTRYCTVKRITYACFVLPALILYLITVVFPFFQGIPYSLTNWNLVSSQSQFVGLKNYLSMLKSTSFWKSISNTFQFAAYYIVFANLIAVPWYSCPMSSAC